MIKTESGVSHREGGTERIHILKMTFLLIRTYNAGVESWRLRVEQAAQAGDD